MSRARLSSPPCGRLYERAERERRGLVALITGAAGVGKTRLCAELARGFRAAGAPVFEGICRERAGAYQPFVDVAHQLSTYFADLPSGARAAELVATLSGSGREPHPPELVRGGADPRLALFEQVEQLLCEVASQRPTVLVLHDLHAADAASLSLLAYLARTLAPPHGITPEDGFRGLVVAATQEATPPAWLRDAQAHVIELRELGADGVREFLGSPEVVDRFLQASGGNPRRLAALLERAPREAESLADRLAGLSAGAVRLVRAMALYGRPAGAALLERLAAELGEGRASDEYAAELRDSPLFARSVVSGELRLGFVHDADRGAVAAVTPREDVVAFHRAIGEALAKGLASTEDPTACAEHLLEGQAGERAVDLALAAGERLERSFAYERAISLYERALAATRRDEVAATMEERLAELHQITGDYTRALTVVERVALRSPSAAAAKLAMQTRALAHRAEASFFDGEKEEALAAGRAACALAAGEPRAAPGRMTARNAMGKVYLEQGEIERAVELFRANLDEARATSSPSEVARALVNLGICALRRADYAQAEACYRDGLAAAEQHGDLRNYAVCVQNLGVLAQWRREYAAALRYYQEAAQAFKRLGRRPYLAWVTVDLGDLFVSLGDTERAAEMADLATRLTSEMPTVDVLLANLRARIAAERGDTAAARVLLDGALETVRRLANKDELTTTLLNLARVEILDGDPLAALAVVEQVPLPAAPRAMAGLSIARGEAKLLLGAHDEARVALVEAERGFVELQDDEGRVRCLALLSSCAEAVRDTRAAHRARQAARDLDAKLRARVPAEFAACYGREPLRAALAVTAAPRAIAVAPPAAPTVSRFPRVVGSGANMLHVLHLVEKAAGEPLVLLRGESGTGKELIAETIHDCSPRRSGPFVKVNCAALVDTLLLSELFGHERGAFTGALGRRKGRFELAHGGTLLLDEIGDVSPQMQVALLRVLQTRDFERVGGTEAVRVDVHIICATHRDLEAMVADGRFREDLYYRLKAIEIELPPLRARAEDLPELVRHFVARVADERGSPPKRLTRAAMDALVRHPWPGNIRELENVIRSVTLFTDGEHIDLPHLGEYLGRGPGAAATQPVPIRASAVAVARPRPRLAVTPPPRSNDVVPLGDTDLYHRAMTSGLSLRELKRRVERDCITTALAEAAGNITRAAKKLGVTRSRLSQLLREHGLSTAKPEAI